MSTWEMPPHPAPKGTPRIVFLCVANSARSQLAEALARSRFGSAAKVESAGSNPATVHPMARQVLQEFGLDTTSHRSKSVDDLEPEGVDLVVTLCADEVCPTGFGRHRIAWPLPDPAGGKESERLEAFRSTARELAARLEDLATGWLELPSRSGFHSRRPER